MASSDTLNSAIVAVPSNSFDKLCPERVVRISRPSDLISDEIERLKKKKKEDPSKI